MATSIRRALLLPLAGGLAVALAVATVATYLRARDEASALFDVQLSQLASSVTGMPLSVAPGGTSIGGSDAPLVVQVWNRDGVQVYRSRAARDAPERGAPGFSTVQTRATAPGACSACSRAASSCRSRSRSLCATSSRRASRGRRSFRGSSRRR